MMVLTEMDSSLQLVVKCVPCVSSNSVLKALSVFISSLPTPLPSKFNVSFPLQSTYAHRHPDLIFARRPGFPDFLMRKLSTREGTELDQGYTAHRRQRWHPKAGFVSMSCSPEVACSSAGAAGGGEGPGGV